LEMLVQKNRACLLVSIGNTAALLHYTPCEVSIASGSKQALKSLYGMLLEKLSESCRRSRNPELLLVFVGENLIPDAESRLAAVLSRSAVRAVIFSALFIMLYWILHNTSGVDFTLSMLLSLAVTVFAATALPPYLVLRAIPRWRVSREQRVRVYRVVLDRLDNEVHTAALLAKASMARRPGAYSRPEEVRKTLEGWGVPVREISLFEFDFSCVLGAHRRTRLYITSVPEVTALALGPFRGYSGIVLNAELLVDLKPEELSAVLAHELEHLKHKDSLLLSLTLLLGLALLIFAHQLVAQVWVLAAHSAALLAFFTLLCRATEVRADLAAAAEKGAEPLRRAIVKLEYPELVRSTSLRSRILSVVNPSPRPPAWLRIAILEKYSKGGRSFLRAFLANILALKMAVEFDFASWSKSCSL